MSFYIKPPIRITTNRKSPLYFKQVPGECAGKCYINHCNLILYICLMRSRNCPRRARFILILLFETGGEKRGKTKRSIPEGALRKLVRRTNFSPRTCKKCKRKSPNWTDDFQCSTSAFKCGGLKKIKFV